MMKSQTFLFLLLSDVCYDVVDVIRHDVALLTLKKINTTKI